MTAISVSGSKEVWQSLWAKIARGKSADQAAIECGLPLEDVHAALKEHRERVGEFDDHTLRMAAAEALSHGLSRLIKVANEEPGAPEVITSDDRKGKAMIVKVQRADVQAATALVRFALESRKLLKLSQLGAAKMPGGARDLFDAGDESSLGPWSFKEPS